MKFETAETWPDKSAEYKAIAEAASKANAEGKPGVKVILFEMPDPNPDGYEAPAESVLDQKRAALRSQLLKHGRFDVIREGFAAFVRVSASEPRTRKVATKKAAAAGGKK